MAARITKEGFEVAIVPTTQNVRVTKVAFEVAARPTTQVVRVTKVAFEVAYVAFVNLAPTGLTDTLAQPWTDSVTTGVGVPRIAFTDTLTLSDSLRIGYGLPFSDNLNSWTDALAYNYLAPATPLSVSVFDRFVRNGAPTGGNLSFRDGFAYVLGPNGPVFISVSDLGSFLSDDLALGLTLRVTDSLNSWTDATGPSYGLSVSAFDSMFFNLFDSFAFGFDTTPVGGGSGDSFTLTDGISIQLNIALSFGDSLSFADAFGGTFLSVNAFGDTLSMSDLAGVQLNLGMAFTDSFTLTDGFTSGAATLLGTSVSDDLNNWQDGFASQSSTGETTYLRQYLNDVIN